jgi:hypothetical protein
MNTAAKSPELTRLAELSASIERIDEGAEIAEQRANLMKRRQELEERLKDLRASRPSDAPPQEPLVDALAADPSAMPDDAAITEVIERRASVQVARQSWEAKVSLLERAIAKIDDDRAQLQADEERAQEDRDALWIKFIKESHAYLSGLFRERWEQLYVEVVGPLGALEQQRDMNANPIINYIFTPRLTDETLVKFHSHASGRGPVFDQLFPKLSSPHTPLGYDGEMDRFRAELHRRS